MAIPFEQSDETLKQLQAERARRLRGNRKREREPPLHAGGFSKTAQCQKCSSYRTKTRFTDRGHSIREHICNLCGWRFKTEMIDIEPPTKQVKTGLRRTPRASRMMLTHNGRTMSVSEWASETGLSYCLIRSRIRSGMSVQEALTSPPKQHIKLTHNGVTADVNTWAINIGVGSGTIKSRLRNGWTVERTLSTPVQSRTSKLSRVSARREPSRQVSTLTFDGRTQTLRQWSREVGVRCDTIRNRIRMGWTAEKALSTSGQMRKLTFDGVTLSIREWAAKTGLPDSVIRSRLRDGWTEQEAVGTPYRQNRKPRARKVKPDRQATPKRTLTHDGRTMSVSEWGRATGLSAAVIHGRLRMGWPVEKVLQTRVKPAVMLTHDGREMSAADWAREVGVSLQILMHRRRRGWSVRETLETPVGSQRVKGNENEQA